MQGRTYISPDLTTGKHLHLFTHDEVLNMLVSLPVDFETNNTGYRIRLRWYRLRYVHLYTVFNVNYLPGI